MEVMYAGQKERKPKLITYRGKKGVLSSAISLTKQKKNTHTGQKGPRGRRGHLALFRKGKNSGTSYLWCWDEKHH